MGEYADDEIDRGMDQWFEDAIIPRKKRKGKRRFVEFQSSDPSQWRDNDGKHWNMSDMSFDHINNVVKLLESKRTYPEKLRALKVELAKRHEQWQKDNDPAQLKKNLHDRLFAKPEKKNLPATTSQEEQADFFENHNPDNWK